MSNTVGIPPDPAEIPTNSIRKQAEGRQFALGRSDEAIKRVSAGVFWSIWRDGGNEMMKRSATLAQIYREASEEIMFMAEAERAAPPNMIALCLAIVQDAASEPEVGYTSVSVELIDRLRNELRYHGYLKGPTQ
jgi:hypothetical protein